MRALRRARSRVAAINAPRSVGAVRRRRGRWPRRWRRSTAQGVGHRRLPVHYAFHSAQMAPFQRRLADALARPRLVGAIGTRLLDRDGWPRRRRALRRRLLRPQRARAGALRERHRRDGRGRPRRLPRDRPAPGARRRHRRVPGGGRARRAGCSPRCGAAAPSARRCSRPAPGSTPPAARPTGRASSAAPGEVVSLPAYPWQRKRSLAAPTAGVRRCLRRARGAAGAAAPAARPARRGGRHPRPDLRGRLGRRPGLARRPPHLRATPPPGAAALELLHAAAAEALGPAPLRAGRFRHAAAARPARAGRGPRPLAGGRHPG